MVVTVAAFPVMFPPIGLFTVKLVRVALPFTKLPTKLPAVTVPPGPTFKLVPVAAPMLGAINKAPFSITNFPVPVWFVVTSAVPPPNFNVVPNASPMSGLVSFGEVKVLFVSVSMPVCVANIPDCGSVTIPELPISGPFKTVTPELTPASRSEPFNPPTPPTPGIPNVLTPVTC